MCVNKRKREREKEAKRRHFRILSFVVVWCLWFVLRCRVRLCLSFVVHSSFVLWSFVVTLAIMWLVFPTSFVGPLSFVVLRFLFCPSLLYCGSCFVLRCCICVPCFVLRCCLLCFLFCPSLCRCCGPCFVLRCCVCVSVFERATIPFYVSAVAIHIHTYIPQYTTPVCVRGVCVCCSGRSRRRRGAACARSFPSPTRVCCAS